MNILKIWPRIESAVGLKHPHGPTMSADGAHWPDDGFTARMLTDGSVTRDQKEALKAAAPAAPTPDSAPAPSAADKPVPSAG